MTPDDLTLESLPQILLNPESRRALLGEMKREQGSRLPFRHRISDLVPKCRMSPETLATIVELLLEDDPDEHVLSGLVCNPAMGDETLARLLDAGRCLPELGHRSGPEWLLLRMANEHHYEESILTLALHHYGVPEASPDKFLAFVQKHIALHWLRSSIRDRRGGAKVEPARREAAFKLIEEYEATIPEDLRTSSQPRNAGRR